MSRTLSSAESQVVLELQWLEKSSVTLDELQELTGRGRAHARYMAHRLVKKGWLERLRPGTYKLIPADRGVDGVPDTNPFRVEAALDFSHFFSFATAAHHHGLIDQLGAEYYLAAPRRSSTFELGGLRFRVVQVPEERFFGWEVAEVFGQEVPMATPERALLDSLDRPRYAGGLGEVSLMVRRAARRIDWARLFDFLERFESAALAQRLGYLLDLHGSHPPGGARRALLKRVRAGNKVCLGSRARWGTRGTLDPTWLVHVNVPEVVLRDATKEGRGPG